ncbi:MAG: HpcH/HpaI aldolase/citrate lyase family protein [Pseudomonadota bacterium]
MTSALHPSSVLYRDSKPFPALPACEHYAGAEKLILKALQLQQQLGPLFDVTCDCEDGAPAGREREHAQMVAELIASGDNRHDRVGLRVHDITHPHWRPDLEIVLSRAGARLAYVTLPKVGGRQDAQTMIMALRAVEKAVGLTRQIPVHVLIETHGALREAHDIAALPGVEVLDFGLMDFVSGHHGAIPAWAMKSPGQFEHPLVVRAKCEIAAAALAHGVVPSHNVTTELRDTTVVYNDARRAREQFGYLRMWSIHPGQIQPIVDAMRPDFAEAAEAAEILAAAQDAAWGPVRHGGRLHDRASYRYYWELLQRAHLTGVALPEAIRARFFA